MHLLGGCRLDGGEMSQGCREYWIKASAKTGPCEGDASAAILRLQAGSSMSDQDIVELRPHFGVCAKDDRIDIQRGPRAVVSAVVAQVDVLKAEDRRLDERRGHRFGRAEIQQDKYSGPMRIPSAWLVLEEVQDRNDELRAALGSPQVGRAPRGRHCCDDVVHSDE